MMMSTPRGQTLLFVDKAGSSEEMSGLLARRLTVATPPEPSGRLGLGRPERVNNRTRRVEREMAKSQKRREEIAGIEYQILYKTKTRSDPNLVDRSGPPCARSGGGPDDVP